MNNPHINNFYMLNTTFINYWLYYIYMSGVFTNVIYNYNFSLLKNYKLLKYNNHYIFKKK